MRKFIVLFGAISTVLVVYFIGIYTITYCSGSLEKARFFAIHSNEVLLELGSVSDARPIPLRSNLEEDDESGHAELAMKVVGSKASGELIVTLDKKSKIWSVTSATLNKREIAP
jgi:Cytochrome oxidase complex assembly protein 1